MICTLANRVESRLDRLESEIVSQKKKKVDRLNIDIAFEFFDVNNALN